MPACPATRSSAIRGGDPADNAAALRRLLQGEPGAYRDAVLLNAAAALVVAGRGRRPGAKASRKPPKRSTRALANALLDCWIAYRMTDMLDRDPATPSAREVAARKAATSLAELDARIAAQTPPRGFRAALDAQGRDRLTR